MAGGNPTAWRGALPAAGRTPGAGRGRAQPCRGGGRSRVAVSRPPAHAVAAGTPVSPASVEQLRHGRAQPDPVALGGGGHAGAPGRAARRRGSPAGPGGPSTRPRRRGPPRRSASAPRSAVRTTSDSISAWVPSKHGPVRALQPGEERAPDQPHGPSEAARVARGGERREPLDVGGDRVTEPEVDAAAAGARGPSAVRPSARRASEAVECSGRRRHRALGPERQRPLGVAHAAPVEGQVDHELERGRAPEGLGGAPHGDRAEDRDLDGTPGPGHDGERSVRVRDERIFLAAG